ncbi:hypothetical protein BH24DEI2_BH24DEI2_18970 [soil metagenome]
MPELFPSAEVPIELPEEVPQTDPFGLEAHADAASSRTDGRDANLHAAPQILDAQAAVHLRAVEAVLTDGLMTFESVRDPAGAVIEFVWLYVNPAAERIVGRGRDELIGKRLLEEMPGNRETGLFDAYTRVVESGETWQGEFAYTYEGLNSWFSTTAAKVGDGFAVKFTDITERKRAEEALRESEERLRLVVETASDAIVTIDEQSRILYANKATAKVFGHAASDLTGRSLTLLMPEYLRHVHEAGLERYLATGQRHLNWDAVLVPGLHKDGHEVPIEISFGEHTLRGERRFTGILRDVTARKRAEESLRRSQERFHQLADSLPQIVWVNDAAGAATYFNQRWLDYTGLSLEVSLSGSDTAIHPEDVDTVQAAWQEKLQRGEPFEYEMWLRRADGTYRWHLARSVPQRDAAGTLLGWFGASPDIETQKQTEQRLRFQAEASAALASGLDYDATLQKVADLAVPHIADWCAVDRLGAAGELELVALAHVDPAKREIARRLRRDYPPEHERREGVLAVIRSGQAEMYPDIADELLVEAARDATHLELMRAVGFRGIIVVPLTLRGQISGALTLVWSARPCTTADLELATELAQRAAVALDNAQLYEEARAAEARLGDLNKSLERRVAERTADLQDALHELDQFAYIASHDLKAPLRAMDNLAAWIAQDAGEKLSEKSREHLNKLRSRAARMEKLLSDLLVYSRADRLSRVVQTVDVAALVADMTELLEPPPGFRVEVQSAVQTVVTSVVPLETVLRNLLGNAFKHHHKTEGRVLVRLEDVGDSLVLEVADDGPGIPAAFHERVFQVFQTLQPRDQVEASGIGLAVVKKIVEGRGGAVSLRSTPGQGATFRVTWPKEVDAPATRSVPKPAEPRELLSREPLS